MRSVEQENSAQAIDLPTFKREKRHVHQASFTSSIPSSSYSSTDPYRDLSKTFSRSPYIHFASFNFSTFSLLLFFKSALSFLHSGGP
ncbi:hypothetical protein L218DRAFT_907195 [Marasmius fiardii PR-910]|nr:hypothetical protein L218DRAFT_907195 [Marasmius fiardii PR-910]